MVMQTYTWYQQLIKPSWAPPASIFGPVWTVLYIGIAITFGTVFFMAAQKKISWMVTVPFALNLLFNFAYTPLQFGLQNNVLAAIDIILVLVTLIWAMRSIAPHARWITYAQIPYLLWVSFATCLQLTITYINFR
jgi:tryptophan-rich sensory protein